MFRPLSRLHAWLYLQTYRGKLEFLIPYALQFINRCPLTLTKKMLLRYHTDFILSCSNASPIESPKCCPNTLMKIPQRDGCLSLFSHFVLQSAKAYCDSSTVSPQNRHSSASLYLMTIFTHHLNIAFCLKTSPIAECALECLTNSKRKSKPLTWNCTSKAGIHLHHWILWLFSLTP